MPCESDGINRCGTCAGSGMGKLAGDALDDHARRLKVANTMAVTMAHVNSLAE